MPYRATACLAACCISIMTSLPNLLTLARIAVIPVIVALLYVAADWARWTALLLYLAACVTDYLDGYLARTRGEVSPLGRFLDPIADKLLVVAVIVVLTAQGWLSVIGVLAGLAIICREILVSGLREYLAEFQVVVHVSKLAKWKTAVQMLALAVLILGQAGPDDLALPLLGEALLVVAALLTLVTGYQYLREGIRHMTANGGGNG